MSKQKKQEVQFRRRVGITEVEQMLHASRSTITRWAKAGRLAAPHYLGTRRLWYLDEIEKFSASATPDAQQLAASSSEERRAK